MKNLLYTLHFILNQKEKSLFVLNTSVVPFRGTLFMTAKPLISEFEILILLQINHFEWIVIEPKCLV